MKTSLWWIRRDLRLRDNQALNRALIFGDQVLPVFVLDPKLLKSPTSSENRNRFLYDGLRALDIELRKKGSYLVVRSGDPIQVLIDLLREASAEAIFAEEDYSPYARRRDQLVGKNLPLHLVPGLTVQAPDNVVKSDGTPYTVFTPFSKAWQTKLVTGKNLPIPEHIPTPVEIHSEEIPARAANSSDILFKAGETEARRILHNFFGQAIIDYADQRNRMDLEGTSGLSPYLRFGMLSAREAVEEVSRVEAQSPESNSRQGLETWLNEIIWREFYQAVLCHFPYVRKMSFRPEMRALRWLNDAQDFAAWKEGRTGYPIVDAAMRQLLLTGWMHNRARMITASFLTKDLLVDWRWGEQFFMQHLIDGDPAANNGGWQWSAGTGTDAAPYFRIFNPVLQGQKFDPFGAYVRHWLPELEKVPDKYIHAPWKMPVEIQHKVGFTINETYPAPIVDHAMARERALLVYRQ